jgi:hypothetical protein
VGVSRLRWILAGAVALLALVASVNALDVYLAHHLTVGVLAVAALAVTLAVGLASLALARRRIGGELAALQASPPGGELLAARRQRLLSIKAAGARPDRDVLAEAAAAAEAGRAYFGRYLVATTVLIGLVGTFAGLMATLGKVAPLLGDKETGGLALLAEPLAGLHVTFGASLVAILATLALALAQGDLALHEGLALAALEDRTIHDLYPALWPPAEEAGERTVRAVEELRASLASAVVAALEGSARRLAEGARAESERGVRALEAAAATVTREVTRLCAAVTTGLEEANRRHAEALDEVSRRQTTAAEDASRRHAEVMDEVSRRQSAAAEETTRRQSAAAEEVSRRQGEALDEVNRRQSAALDEVTRRQSEALAEATLAITRSAAAATEEGVRRSTEVAEQAVRAATEQLAGTLGPLFAAEDARLEGVREGLARSATGIEQAVTRLAEVGAAVEAVSRAHAETVEQAGRGVLAAFDRAVLGGGAALGGAASALAAAARDLRAGAETFAPRMAALSAELGPLTREVALLAARDPDGDLSAAVLGELERLGAGVERLDELVRLAQTKPPEPDEPAPLEAAAEPAPAPAPAPADEPPPEEGAAS